MEKEKFIQVGKRMVKEYFNRYIVDDEDEEIREIDIELISFAEDDDMYKLILTTPDIDHLYYGVTYNKNTKKINSFIYEKEDFRILGRKENI